MSESHPNRDDRPADGADLDAYLDGLSPAGGETPGGEAPAAWHEAAALQGKIDEQLARAFPSAVPSSEHLAQIAPLFAEARDKRRFVRRRWVLRAAAAAAAIGLAWFFLDRTTVHQAPFFEPTPLADLYRDAVAAGFEPYYECRELDRLTTIFAQRLGARLHLLEMPPGSRMLGLSYPGGLSRDTTAMLCRVDGAPVMVLVDRPEADRQQPPPGARPDDALYLHRTERDQLVFYEVSPFDQPRAMQYLVAGDATPAR